MDEEHAVSPRHSMPLLDLLGFLLKGDKTITVSASANETSSKTGGEKNKNSGVKNPHPGLPELPPPNEITKAIKQGVFQSGIFLEEHDTRQMPCYEGMVFGFKSKKLEKYLPRGDGNAYIYYVGLRSMRNQYYAVKCDLALYPRQNNRRPKVMKNLKKVFELFHDNTSNEELKDKKQKDFYEYVQIDIDGNKITPSAIIKAVKDAIKLVNDRIENYNGFENF